MRILFIRHGDPDYTNDSLTPKGWREAELLADRVENWDFITDIYCSPLGRAKDTASRSLARLQREAQIYDWMQEFWHPIHSPYDGRLQVCWDLMPDYWTGDARFMNPEKWLETPLMRSNPEIAPAYRTVCEGLDGILARYGYLRTGRYYTLEDGANRNAAIVIFCHLGVTLAMMSHLLNISPVQLWQGVYLAPTSVTMVATEERQSGIAGFRAQVIGDTAHLHDGGEAISASGFFTDTLQF